MTANMSFRPVLDCMISSVFQDLNQNLNPNLRFFRLHTQVLKYTPACIHKFSNIHCKPRFSSLYTQVFKYTPSCKLRFSSVHQSIHPVYTSLNIQVLQSVHSGPPGCTIRFSSTLHPVHTGFPVYNPAPVDCSM